LNVVLWPKGECWNLAICLSEDSRISLDSWFDPEHTVMSSVCCLAAHMEQNIRLQLKLVKLS
jgi:hypothetical protein